MNKITGLLTGSCLAIIMVLALEIATQTHRTALCWTQLDKQDKSMLMDFVNCMKG